LSTRTLTSPTEAHHPNQEATMPAPKVPALAQLAGKWNRRSASAGPEYEEGIRNPRAPWDQAAVAAKASWQQGVTAAAQRDGYAKGVSAAGLARWQTKSVEKGPARFSQGVAVSQADYERGFAPFRDAIERTDLPPRGPRGSEQNYARVAPIGKALAQLKRR
jgi:hypothetical protein